MQGSSNLIEITSLKKSNLGPKVSNNLVHKEENRLTHQSYAEKIAEKDEDKAFLVNGLRGRVDVDEYIDHLYKFVNLFYKEKTIQETLMSEKLSEILTTSDEAFVLLCIKVYFNNYTDLENDIYVPNNIHVTKNG